MPDDVITTIPRVSFEEDPFAWILQSLRTTRVSFLILQQNIMNVVKDWLATNNRWLKLLIITVVSAFAIVAVSVLGIYLGSTAAQRTILGTLKNLTAMQTLTLLLKVARGTWSILVQVDGQLRELQVAWMGAWEAAGSAIGLPIAFAASFFTSYRALVFSLGAIAGYSPEELRLDWMTNVQDVLDTTASDLQKYALNPGLIFDYLISLPLRYDEEIVSDKTAAELEVLIQNTEDIGSLGDHLQVAKAAIKGLQESLPDEIEDAVSEQTIVIFKKMDEIIDPISETLDRFENVMLPALELLLEDTETRLQTQIDTYGVSISEMAHALGFDLDDPEERKLFMENYYGEMIAGNMFPAGPLAAMSNASLRGETEGNADTSTIFQRSDLEQYGGLTPVAELVDKKAWYLLSQLNVYREVNPWRV